MAIKIKVESRGIVTEKTDGNPTIDVVLPRKYVYSANNYSIGETEYVVLAPTGSAGITGSLPAIASSNLGKVYTIMSAGTNPVLVSGSNSINSGSFFTVSLSGNYPSVTLMAMSSSTGGLYWHKINQQ